MPISVRTIFLMIVTISRDFTMFLEHSSIALIKRYFHRLST